VLCLCLRGCQQTALLTRFAEDKFNEGFGCTIGVDFRLRTIQLDDKTVKLQMWDTSGSDRFVSISRLYYRGAHGIMIVYDVTRRDSFHGVQRWLGEVDQHSSGRENKMLIGTKVRE
jgi:Ras-related protein Rab-1A